MTYILPLIFAFVGIVMSFSKKDTLSMFSEGCKCGLLTTVKLLPTLILLLVAVRMLSASGVIDYLCDRLGGLCRFIGIPKELLPIIIMRPLSASGTNAVAQNIFESTSPNSLVSRTAVVFMGCTDTALYTISMYFSHIGEKKTGFCVPVSIIVLLLCAYFSHALCRYIFMP